MINPGSNNEEKILYLILFFNTRKVNTFATSMLLISCIIYKIIHLVSQKTFVGWPNCCYLLWGLFIGCSPLFFYFRGVYWWIHVLSIAINERKNLSGFRFQSAKFVHETVLLSNPSKLFLTFLQSMLSQIILLWFSSTISWIFSIISGVVGSTWRP